MVKRKVYYSRLTELIERNKVTRRMSRIKLAKEIGISRATLYNWLAAENEDTPFAEIPTESAAKIARYFGLKTIEETFRIKEVEIKFDQQAPVPQLA